ncbi:hypothetical protein [Thiothrix nivea]|uniref:Uncharacterized protein n=1 Tax=Thiothrix nivea (strain ATCC 35100 / DSM 5205 / JP2) TaxID=870187 RepID=A0A656HIF0_THINJ|nr:hypothetical protein [Thiothrix nivea]EIJ36227.1 hypothetical protein Thini_3724 [Thiothrix nivea DSM 5205]
MMANYAKYQQMLKADVHGGGQVAPHFVSFGSRVTGHSKEVSSEEWREAFEERAAIMEYSGGLPKHEAERQARVICLAEFRNRKR